MAGLFGVGLVALEIVDRGGDEVPCPLAWTHRVDGVADGQQDLERDHDFVVF